MAERMTRYQLAFAPFLNKYIDDELSKHYGDREADILYFPYLYPDDSLL